MMASSCKDNTNGIDHDPTRPITITSFYPDSGRITEKIIFSGENFGTHPDLIRVWFDDRKAKVVGSDGSDMYVVCPRIGRDTECTIAVAIGNDSIVLDHKFRYKVSVTVSTVAGNGINEFKDGSLATATLRARYLAVDQDGNVFAIQRSDETMALILIDEEENTVTKIQDIQPYDPNALCIFKDGIICIPADWPNDTYFEADPALGWAVKEKHVNFSTADKYPAWDAGGEWSINGNTGRYKHSMAACDWDGKVYCRWRNGSIGRFSRETGDVEWLYNTPHGDSYGCAFDPRNPTILYLAYTGDVQEGQGHAIYTIDVSVPDQMMLDADNVWKPSPASTYTRISSPITGGGFRNGPINQARFWDPCQIYFDPDGVLYIADRSNHCIRRLTTEGIVETVVGIPGQQGMMDGPADEALFRAPYGLGVAPDGSVYVADYDNARVRKLTIE
jgi:hypothetical protein